MWAWSWSCRTCWMWAWSWSCRTCWMWAWSWSCRTCWMWAWSWSCRTCWMWAWSWSCRTCWMWAWSWSCRTCWMVIRSRCGWLITRSGATLWRPIDMNCCCSVSNRAIWEVNINLLYVITWNLHIIYNLLGVSPPCCCSGWDGSTTCQNHKGWWLRGNQAVGNLWCW